MANNISPSKPSHYPPSKTALLFLDYQNLLINMIPDAERKEKLIQSAKALLETARENNVAIFHCLVDVKADPPVVNKVRDQWLTAHKPALETAPELAEEYGEFASSVTTGGAKHERVSLRPPGYRSALIDTDLVRLLREELGIVHLILGGIATSGAVLGTVLHGTDVDFVVSVVEDAVWDPNESVHRALVDSTIPTLAWVATTEEAISYMKGKH